MQQRAEQFFEELLADRTALEVDVDSAAEQLREVTRSTARVLQTQPAIMDMVRRKSDQSEGTYRFCEYLRDLTVRQRCRILARVGGNVAHGGMHELGTWLGLRRK